MINGIIKTGHNDNLDIIIDPEDARFRNILMNTSDFIYSDDFHRFPQYFEELGFDDDTSDSDRAIPVGDHPPRLFVFNAQCISITIAFGTFALCIVIMPVSISIFPFDLTFSVAFLAFYILADLFLFLDFGNACNRSFDVLQMFKFSISLYSPFSVSALIRIMT